MHQCTIGVWSTGHGHGSRGARRGHSRRRLHCGKQRQRQLEDTSPAVSLPAVLAEATCSLAIRASREGAGISSRRAGRVGGGGGGRQACLQRAL